jgi:hypothetical protein
MKWFNRVAMSFWNLMAPYGYQDSTGFHYGTPFK